MAGLTREIRFFQNMKMNKFLKEAFVVASNDLFLLLGITMNCFNGKVILLLCDYCKKVITPVIDLHSIGIHHSNSIGINSRFDYRVFPL